MENEFEILGTRVNPLTVDKLHEVIDGLILQNAKVIITNVNVRALNIAYKETWFRSFINHSYLTFCDGAGVILGAKILGQTIPERITYADWMWKLAKFCEEHNYSLFLLGGKPGVSEGAARKLLEAYPKLRIAGTNHGYFDKKNGSNENQAVINLINESQPNILIVGFGMPIQEKWLNENWQEIDANIALSGGAVFDYISGKLKRGPKWMTDHGMEWLARMLIEPKRLWKRYIIGNPIFLYHVILQRLGLIKLLNRY